MRTNKLLLTVNDEEMILSHQARNKEIYKGIKRDIRFVIPMIMGYLKGINVKSPGELLIQGNDYEYISYAVSFIDKFGMDWSK